MALSNRGKTAILLAATGGGFLLDLWTKNWARAYFAGHPPIVVLNGLLELRYVENTAVGFSLLRSLPANLRFPFIYFTNAAALVGLGFLIHRWRGRGLGHLLPLALIAAGAVGNLSGRIRYGGHVVDFVHLHYKHLLSWPIFNVADSLIFVGVVLFLWVNREEFLGRRRSRHQPAAPDET